jgi:uncharacterized membrane protein YgcG
MWIGRLVVATQLVLAGLGGAADASGPRLTIVQPAQPFMSFGPTPFDQPSAPQRVLVRNDGDPVGFEEVFASGPFTIVASGGGLGTGEVKFWDLACVPFSPSGFSSTGHLSFDLCGSSCEDEWQRSIQLSCQGGLLQSPENDVFLFAYAYDSMQDTASFTNPGPDPLTVTSLGSHDPMFSAAPASGTLPVTLAPGDRIDVAVTFSPTRSGDAFGYADVLADTAVIGRVGLRAETINQIAVPAVSFEIPLGAHYAMPITVRNSYPTARTIAAVVSDHGDDIVTGLAGVTLAPGEIAWGTVTIAADVLGSRLAALAVDFDTGQGDVRRFGNIIVPVTYAVTASDATPDDDMIDFGVRKAGSAPFEQTFTVANLTASDVPVSFCDAPVAPFELVACPAVLPANGSVQVAVRFAPTTAGTFLYSVSLHAGSSLITGLLSARAVASQLAFSSEALAFPDTMQGASVQQHVTISNDADNAITVPAIVTGAGFATAAAEVTIPGRATADVAVDFTPPGGGLFTAALELGTVGDPDHAIIALSGTGIGVTPPPPPDGGAGDDGMPGGSDGGTGGGSDGGTGGGGGETGGGHGGCSTGGGGSGVALALLALVRRRSKSSASGNAGHRAV